MGIFRFLLALNVIFYHLLDVPNIGALAVYSFFILSGFLMTYIMHKTYSYDFKGVLGYAINRFWRIYPIYWCLIAFTLLAFYFGVPSSEVHPRMVIPAGFSEWLANLSLIYPEKTPVTYPVRIAPASWALTIEIVFYVLIGLGISRTKFITWLWVLFSVAILIHHILFGGSYSMGYGTLASASLPFSVGALSYYYKDEIYNLLNKGGSYTAFLLVGLFSVNVLLSASSDYLFGIDQGWKINLLTVYANLFLSMLLVIYLSRMKFKHKKVDRVLGDLSYPVYIFHWGGAYISFSLFGSFDTPLTFLVALAATLLVSFFVNWLVMEKINRIREKIKLKSYNEQKV